MTAIPDKAADPQQIIAELERKLDERCPCRKPIDWRLIENRAMLLCNERSFQAHCLGGCRSVSVAGSARGRDFNVAATDHCSATNRPQETNLRCHQPFGVLWSLSPLPSRSYCAFTL